MPDAAGNFRGISLGGKAAEAWERIFGGEDEDVVSVRASPVDDYWTCEGCGVDCSCCCTCG